MTIRPPLTLPPYTPTSWELRLPGYPVMTNSWRSASFPEVLGSMPSEARLQLVFENKTSDEALALLLPWKATGGGQWPLTTLPEEIAYGINDANFAKRLTETTWTIEAEPQKLSVKKGRFNITVDLVYELTFDSRYGPINPQTTLDENPVWLKFSNTLVTIALPTSLFRPPANRNASAVIEMNVSGEMIVSGTPVETVKIIPQIPAGPLVETDVSGDLTVAAVNPTL